jgi:predicted small secreted protein
MAEPLSERRRIPGMNRIRSWAPLALVLISALVAACKNGSGGSGY